MIIDLALLPIFLAAATVLVLSPGPDLILISTYSSSQGYKAGLMISVGVFVAGVLQTLLVAFGLGQLMEFMPIFAYALKTVGVLYLSYLGVCLIRTWFKGGDLKDTTVSKRKTSNVKLIRLGLLNNLLNPKALIFFSLFLPQFISDIGSITYQICTLGLILSLYAFLVNSVFSFAFSKIGQFVGSKLTIGRHIDGLLGLFFLGLAARLGTSK